jgi:hypothetical protein
MAFSSLLFDKSRDVTLLSGIDSNSLVHDLSQRAFFDMLRVFKPMLFVSPLAMLEHICISSLQESKLKSYSDLLVERKLSKAEELP